jgi:hypothetical protein
MLFGDQTPLPTLARSGEHPNPLTRRAVLRLFLSGASTALFKVPSLTFKML